VQPRLMETGALILEGGANIRDLESHLHIRLPRDEGFETLGGFVMWRLGRLPRSDDVVEFEGRRYTVLQMQDRRVLQVKVESLTALPEQEADEQPSLFHNGK
jgi:putative hemolysin